MCARKTTLTYMLEATLLIAAPSFAIEPPANRVAVGILSQLAFLLRYLLMGILEMLIASAFPEDPFPPPVPRPLPRPRLGLSTHELGMSSWERAVMFKEKGMMR